MKAKKGKDLVLELMGDLLGDSNDKDPKKAKQDQPTGPTKSHLNFGTGTADQKAVAPKSTNKKAKELDKPFAKRPVSGGGAPVITRAEASLAQSENLRIAQQKIIELEKEMDRLREENESLAAAGDTLRRRADEILVKAEKFERKFNDSKDTFDQEKEILLDSMKSKEYQVQEFKMKIDELETRLSSNIRKIRVRERELENRLELVKLESSTMIRSKDEIILDLKRQVDQLSQEMESFRIKGQKLNHELDTKQDILRRTVKALRLALAMLEGSDFDEQPLKKAE